MSEPNLNLKQLNQIFKEAAEDVSQIPIAFIEKNDYPNTNATNDLLNTTLSDIQKFIQHVQEQVAPVNVGSDLRTKTEDLLLGLHQLGAFSISMTEGKEPYCIINKGFINDLKTLNLPHNEHSVDVKNFPATFEGIAMFLGAHESAHCNNMHKNPTPEGILQEEIRADISAINYLTKKGYENLGYLLTDVRAIYASLDPEHATNIAIPAHRQNKAITLNTVMAAEHSKTAMYQVLSYATKTPVNALLEMTKKDPTNFLQILSAEIAQGTFKNLQINGTLTPDLETYISDWANAFYTIYTPVEYQMNASQRFDTCPSNDPNINPNDIKTAIKQDDQYIEAQTILLNIENNVKIDPLDREALKSILTQDQGCTEIIDLLKQEFPDTIKDFLPKSKPRRHGHPDLQKRAEAQPHKPDTPDTLYATAASLLEIERNNNRTLLEHEASTLKDIINNPTTPPEVTDLLKANYPDAISQHLAINLASSPVQEQPITSVATDIQQDKPKFQIA